MKKIHTALVVVLVLMARRGFAQSAQQAQSLPVAELAHLVLGKVGSSVVAVDRPQWPLNCRGGGLCPFDANEEEARGPAPLTEGMTFYQRPEPARGGLQWTGLCSSTAIRVIYDSKGTPGTLTLTQRFGLSNAALRSGYDHVPDTRSNSDVEDRQCAATTAISRFFSASEETMAFNAALATRLVHNAAHNGTKVPFSVECSQGAELCASVGNSLGEIAQNFIVENFRGVSKAKCEKALLPVKGERVCYTIDLQGFGQSVDVEMAGDSSRMRIVKLTYRLDSIMTDPRGNSKSILPKREAREATGQALAVPGANAESR